MEAPLRTFSPLIIIVAFQAISQCLGVCRDLDPLACPQIATQNPSMCMDPLLSTSMCPSYCNKCACHRDIEILIQDARTYTAPTYIKQYFQSMVKSLEIGPDATQIGVTLFDSSIHGKISLNNQMDQTSLLTALGNLHFRQVDNHIDADDVRRFLHSTITVQHTGDRPSYPNVVIIFVNHQPVGFLQQLVEGVLFGRAIYQEPVAKNVIVINVGVHNSQSPFSNLATDANHVIHVSHLYNLQSSLPELLQLICQN